MSPGRVKIGVEKPRLPKKPIVHKKYCNPNALIIRDGKCYSNEEYYGKNTDGTKK